MYTNTKNTSLLSISYLDVGELKCSPNNARLHPPAQIKRLAKSIRAFGFLIPVLIGSDDTLIAGHGRVEAAKQLGIDKVPTVRIEHLTKAQERAFRIADNRLTEFAEWSPDILGEEFRFLMTVPDFDLTVTGFDTPKIDLLIQGVDRGNEEEAEVHLPISAIAVSKMGDLWLLGNHRLFCGDSLKEKSYFHLLGGEKAQQVVTDPPYNVSINGHVSGLGKAQHAEFLMAAGEMNSDQFKDFLRTSLSHMAEHSIDGSIHHIFMDWRHIHEMMLAGSVIYSEFKNLCVWNKDNGGMGSLYRSKHELVFVFKHGDAPHINNIELGKHGRYRTNVWDYAGQNSLHANRSDELAMHPTVKPVTMLADAILDCSHRGGIILDPFGGSGSTLLAAEKTGRKARLIELEPRYVDVTIRRWQSLTGKQALHAESGKPFDALEEEPTKA